MTVAIKVAPAMEAEFDRYDREYQKLVDDSISFAGVKHDYVTRVKADLITAAARRRFGSLDGRKVLDVGCGVGLTDQHLTGQPWQLFGTDLSAKSLDQARQRNPQVTYVVGEENRLPFDDESFDLCFAICVLHHVPPVHWTAFLSEMRRVIRPDGLVMILEHNPWNPLTRLVVSRCPFDADAVLVGKNTLRSRLRAAKLNPLASRFFLFTPWEKLRSLDGCLGWLPLGAQYLVAATR